MSWRQATSTTGVKPAASRAINLDIDENAVRTACAKHGVTISAIEVLQSGGTRVVLMSGAAAETMRKAFGKRVLTGEVQRAPLRTWIR